MLPLLPCDACDRTGHALWAVEPDRTTRRVSTTLTVELRPDGYLVTTLTPSTDDIAGTPGRSRHGPR